MSKSALVRRKSRVPQFEIANLLATLTANSFHIQKIGRAVSRKTPHSSKRKSALSSNWTGNSSITSGTVSAFKKSASETFVPREKVVM